MSLHEYLCSQAISANDPPFYALLFAMIRQADDRNLQRIRMCWPDKHIEMKARYNAPGGVLPDDGEVARDIIVDASGGVLWVCGECGHNNSQMVEVCEECDMGRGGK